MLFLLLHNTVLRQFHIFPCSCTNGGTTHVAHTTIHYAHVDPKSKRSQIGIKASEETTTGNDEVTNAIAPIGIDAITTTVEPETSIESAIEEALGGL